MARRTQQQELVALFAADGMTLDPALIPADTELSAYTLLRDETLEKNAAAFWLVTISERTSQGGGIYTYSGSHGAAVFRDTGSFDIAGTLSVGDAASLCRDFCKKFSYTEPAFTLDETGSGTATADCWNGDWTAVTHIALGFEIRGVAEDVLARCVNLVSFETIKGSWYLRTYNGGLISEDSKQMLAAPNKCTAYEIPDLVQTVKTGAFRYCQGLTAVTFPASLTTIEAQAFTSCLSLTDVQLPDGLKTIGDFAFAGCAALTSVLIPKSVTSIGAGAFAGCTALTAIDYSGTAAEWAQLTKGENALPEGVAVNFNAPIHHYGSWTGTYPSCTTEGQRTRACTDDGCGHTEEMTLPARGHYWDVGRVTTPPTETTTGVRTYTCRIYGCNATRTEEIPKLAPQVPVSERFDDVDPNGWACEDIQYCVDHDLMNGTGNRTFAPKMVMTRAQMVQVLYNIVGEPAVTGETTFTDLTANWYQNAVLWAYQTGVASGMSETTFAPDDPVTREQVTVFLAEFADRVLDKYTPYMWDALFPFQDRESISYYARTAMNWACNLGLIKGIPGPGGLRLEPQSYATREQMAVILAQFCRELNVWNEPIPEL